MDEINTENRIDLRELRLNTVWIVFCYLAYMGPLDLVILILLFHYLDWGWARRQFSPFSKLSRGILKLGGPKPVWRNAGPHQARARIHFLVGTLLCGDFFLDLPWVFEGVAGGLVVFALLEAAEKLSGRG